MTQRRMTHLSLAVSKKYLDNHVINAAVVTTRNNGTIINEITKYYDGAVNGFGKLMFLQ
jgi:hypothetical protein